MHLPDPAVRVFLERNLVEFYREDEPGIDNRVVLEWIDTIGIGVNPDINSDASSWQPWHGLEMPFPLQVHPNERSVLVELGGRRSFSLRQHPV